MAEAIRLEDMTGEAQQAAARSQAYAALVWAFDYPDAEFVTTVRGGALAEALRATQGAVDPALAAGEWSALEDAGTSDDDLAVEYTRLFDVGTGGPPCPLYGGLYAGARMQTMEECVRFYNHFGLTLAEAPRELPDHISTQLEFLHFLAFREAEALARRPTIRGPGSAPPATSSSATRAAGSPSCARSSRSRIRCRSSQRSWTGSSASSRTNAASARSDRRRCYPSLARSASRSRSKRSRSARASWRSAAAA